MASGSTKSPVDLENDAGFIAELEGVLMGE